MRIKEKDQYKAAFKMRYGTYLPQVMYFGLKNAPPFFQKLMYRDFGTLLQKYLENLGNYMDDWWVATPNDEEGQKLHRQICHEFLDRMKEKSYFLKLLKIKFEEPVIEILGWQVTEDGVRIDPTKVAGIAEWPRDLKNLKEVRSTLEVLGYHRAFIRDFAKWARPLHNLTKKGMSLLNGQTNAEKPLTTS